MNSSDFQTAHFVTYRVVITNKFRRCASSLNSTVRDTFGRIYYEPKGFKRFDVVDDTFWKNLTTTGRNSVTLSRGSALTASRTDIRDIKNTFYILTEYIVAILSATGPGRVRERKTLLTRTNIVE